MTIGLALVTILAAWVLLAFQVDPVPTWFYVFVWYPTLVLLDGIGSVARGATSYLRRPTRTLSLFMWSPVIWLLFEAINFRITNWYYVFLPHHPVERWIGILVSFATVVPALVLAERAFAAMGVGMSWRTRPIIAQPHHLRAATLLGLGTLALALLDPQRFFPLVWGAVWLITDPIVYRRQQAWSLLADIERGSWGRIARLMLGGAAIGILWEFYNGWARGKWIYTVPWLEQLKLFEMPPFGFLGFPFFALEAWALYHLLATHGLAVPADERGDERSGGHGPWGRLAAVAACAAAFSAATLLGMERWTISSTDPRLVDLPQATRAEIAAFQELGMETPFAIAAADTARLANALPDAPERVDSIVQTARLVTLRGIGTAYSLELRDRGVSSVCDLSRADPARLWRGLHPDDTVYPTSRPPTRPTAAEVRVWVRAAQRACRPASQASVSVSVGAHAPESVAR